MRKIIVLTLLLVLAVPAVTFAATNWTKYESGTNNVRLDGYQGQPGYIAFGDGNGTIKGYLYYSSDADELVWVTPDGLDMSTGTRIQDGDEIGIAISEFTGNGSLP